MVILEGINTGLKCLDLSKNEIGGTGAEELAVLCRQSLKANDNLIQAINNLVRVMTMGKNTKSARNTKELNKQDPDKEPVLSQSEETDIILEKVIEEENNTIDDFTAKKFDISLSENDLDKFWKDKQDFIYEYKISQPTMSDDNIYSLLLNTAIVLNNKEVIQYILKIPHSKNILTHVDKLNYSPISRALYSGSKEILELVRAYIEREKSIVKVALTENDFNNIMTILEFSQFEDLTVEKCIEEYLKPLYVDESINQIEEALLGEDNNKAVYEHLSFSSGDEEFIFNESDLNEYCSSIYVSGDCSHT